VPVGRISTALRAHRSGFQDGFRDQSGDEFAFDNLEQIREVIRRGYLAGGLGPVPAPVEGPPPSPFRDEGGSPEPPPIPSRGGEHYEHEVERLSSETPQISLAGLSDNKKRKPLLEEIFLLHHELLGRYLRAFAEATIFEYVQALHGVLHHPHPRATLRKWLGILHALDLWSFQAAERLEMTWLYYHLSPICEPWKTVYWSKEVLFAISCPLRKTWSHNIQTLSHKLFLPLVDRSYYTYNDKIPEFIPGLLCAMIAVLTSDLAASRPFPQVDQRRLIGRACEWFNGQLPQVLLAQGVEDELSNFAWNRIGLNPERSRRRGLDGLEA
jgi:hypothetical protein